MNRIFYRVFCTLLIIASAAIPCFAAEKYIGTKQQEYPSATAELIKSLASILGSSDAYYFMTILAVIALVITLFIPMKKKAPIEEVL